jgi:hypothetical protein
MISIMAGIFPAPWGVPREANVSEPYGLAGIRHPAPWGGDFDLVQLIANPDPMCLAAFSVNTVCG